MVEGIILVDLAAHHSRVLAVIVVHAGLVLLIKIRMIGAVLVMSAILAIAGPCEVALAVFPLDLIPLERLERALIVHVGVVRVHDLWITVTVVRFLALLGTHYHLLVQFVLAVVAVALTGLSHI